MMKKAGFRLLALLMVAAGALLLAGPEALAEGAGEGHTLPELPGSRFRH